MSLLEIAENIAYVCVWKGTWTLLENYTSSDELWVEYVTIAVGALAVLAIGKVESCMRTDATKLITEIEE